MKYNFFYITAGDMSDAGGVDSKSLWPLWTGLHTCYIGKIQKGDNSEI